MHSLFVHGIQECSNSLYHTEDCGLAIDAAVYPPFCAWDTRMLQLERDVVHHTEDCGVTIGAAVVALLMYTLCC